MARMLHISMRKIDRVKNDLSKKLLMLLSIKEQEAEFTLKKLMEILKPI
jgi:hypothetical protein